MLTATAVNIDLVGAEPALLLPEISGSPEGQDDWKGEVGVEEVVGSTFLGVATNWSDSGPELKYC